MTDARGRLEETGALAEVEHHGFRNVHNVDRKLSSEMLDAFLAHPDDLIALLVERGALEQVGTRTTSGEMFVYRRQVREEGRDDDDRVPGV